MTDNVNGYWEALMGHARRMERPQPPRQESFADRYPAEYQWIMSSTFDFALKMRDVLAKYPGLTQGQLDAVRRCMGYEAESATRAREFRQIGLSCPDGRVSAHSTGGLDLSKVPSGLYAVPNGDTRLKVRISQGEDKWQGFTFVTDGAEYGQGRRYGMQRPGQTYRGDIQAQLTVIAADPRAAAAAYGRLVGSCGLCGRKLEDPESVARGIGPICAAKHGW